MRRAAFTIGLLAGALPVLAQTTPPDPDALGAGTSVATFAEAVTVTATAAEEPVDEVPATVAVIGAEEIAERQATEVLPLLRTIPGLALTRTGSPGKAASLFTRGTNSAHTLVLWNGIHLNDPYLGGFDYSTLSTDGVERLEVARGAFSALYGSSAAGGVVQVVTRRSGRGGRARVEGGSNELLRGDLAWGAPMGPLHAEIAGHARRGEGEVANDFWDGDEVSLALDAGGDLPWRAGALVRWARAELGIPFDFAGTPTPARRQESDALSVALPLGWNGGDWELEGHLARSEADLALADSGDPFAASDSEARRDQARLLLRAESAPGITWTAGGDWEEARVSSGSAFGPGLQRQEQGSWALFAQGSFARGPLRLDAGVRRDEVDSFGGQTSLRAAAAVALGERGRLRAAYGESFRAPSLADLYYPGFSNPALAPERVESAELAAELEAGPARAELVLFRNELDDLIEFDYGTFRPENIGRARAEGVELALALKLAALDARLALTWLEAEDRATGRPLLRRPEESASLVAFYRPGRVTVGVVASYVGDRVDFGEVPLASHETLDLSLAFRAHERFEPFARVENVSDERYEEAAGFPAPGRTWAAGCALRF